MTGQLQDFSYPSAPVDLWTAVEGRIGQPDRGLTLSRRLWPIGAFVVSGASTVRRSPDAPASPVVPLAATVAAVWLFAGDPWRSRRQLRN